MSEQHIELRQFIADAMTTAKDAIPDHRLIIGVIRPDGFLAVTHNLEDRTLAPAILRRLADELEANHSGL